MQGLGFKSYDLQVIIRGEFSLRSNEIPLIGIIRGEFSLRSNEIPLIWIIRGERIEWWDCVMEIVRGTVEDIDAWMCFVEQVRDQFPGMETEKAMCEHRETVLDFMEHHTALCAKEQEVIHGVILFSRQYNMICFLAVSPAYRRGHIATKLYQEMLKDADRNRRLVVTTYREGDPRGAAARAFYQKQGFQEDKLIEEFGYPSQIMILKQA